MLARTLYESNMQLANSILRLSFHHNFFHHCNSYVLLSLKRNLVGLQKPFPWPVIGISVERKPDPENFYPICIASKMFQEALACRKLL